MPVPSLARRLPSVRLATLCLLLLFSAPPAVLRSEITIQSFHLRDRAITLDSVVLRKQLIFQFKSSLPLGQVKAAAAAGELSLGGAVVARDTTWLFDIAGGNLVFGLPFDLPEGVYRLRLDIVSPAGKALDSFEGGFDRADMKSFYNREVNFWDFTTPYGHLECGGYGSLTYRFESKTALNPARIELRGRITTDNASAGSLRLALNGVPLGAFPIPAGEGDKTPEVISLKLDPAPAGLEIKPGVNTLSLSVEREDNPQAMGLRLFSRKNSTDPAVEPGVELTLEAAAAGGAAAHYEIPVWGLDGENLTSRFNRPLSMLFTRRQAIEPGTQPTVNETDVARGYVLFSRPWLHYVYPWSAPADSERVDSLSLRMASGDYEPLRLSLQPLRDLGQVRLELSGLAGPGGALIPASEARVHVPTLLTYRSGGTGYRLVPRLLEEKSSVEVPADRTTSFWLTLHVPAGASAGQYRGTVRLLPERGAALELPLSVTVLPVTLEPVPGLDYSMCMSYEFFELESKDLSPADKEKVKQDGLAMFRDYLEHGLTTLAVSSPYCFQWNADGTPRLEHLKATLDGARRAGFTRPVYWYFAHYLQAAKQQHPGNIRLYDPKIMPRRAELLTREALRLDRELGAPPLGFMPIDEPRIALRQRITLELFRAVKKAPGAKIMCTTDIGGKLLDIEDDPGGSKLLAPGQFERKSERKVWQYDNESISTDNPCYSRYVYGLYTWRQDLDGMNSWGPATTENSRGNPFEDLDHESPDYVLIYPHSGRPWPSVNCEAVREGIDDVRYIYQIEKLIAAKASSAPEVTAAASKWLNGLRARCDVELAQVARGSSPWTPEAFDNLRRELQGWAVRLQGL
ncbi:DUF4091 domain-containing protein [bacterium]|nr:DUF4091 domain-containing protein [bacterium]